MARYFQHYYKIFLTNLFAGSPVLWSGCGQTVPPRLLSQSNLVTVTFVSDRASSAAAAGFNMTAVEHTAGCGGQLHGAAGTIVSPRLPGTSSYPASAECVWEILSEPGYHARFTFRGRQGHTLKLSTKFCESSCGH